MKFFLYKKQALRQLKNFLGFGFNKSLFSLN